MYCNQCGNKIDNKGVTFCKYCGNKIHDEYNFHKSPIEPNKPRGIIQLLLSIFDYTKVTNKKTIFGLVILIFSLIIIIGLSDNKNIFSLGSEGHKKSAKMNAAEHEKKIQSVVGEKAKTQNVSPSKEVDPEWQKKHEEAIFGRKAKDLLVAYTNALTINDYKTVYELMSPRRRAEVGPYDRWVKGFTEPNTILVITRMDVKSIEGDRLKLSYDVSVSKDPNGPATVTKGVATIVRIGDRVTIDDIQAE